MTTYVFCASTGRSGTNYLSELLARARDCCALHEPAPVLNGRPMFDFLRGRDAPMRRLMPEKLEAIERARDGREFYVETNHCFIKGFGWLLPELLPPAQLRVVVLRRDPEAVRSSYSRILCSPFLPAGRQWLITPAASPRCVPLPAGHSAPLARYWLFSLLSLTLARPRLVRLLTRGRRSVPEVIARYERDLLDWYVAETEARVREFRRRFPAIATLDVDLEELNEREGVLRLFRWCGMEPGAGWEEILARPTNLKSSRR